MKTVIIGSGNIATVLGETIASAGHTVLQVVARNHNKGTALARTIGASFTSDYSAIDRFGDIYIVALSDAALEPLAAEVSLPGKLIVHTAGAAPVHSLEPVSGRAGVLYPLQSLHAAIRPFPPFPLLIDTTRAGDLEHLENFAKTLSNEVIRAGDATRIKLHLAAVIANNFTNYLYTLTAAYCRREKIDFSILLPLIEETANRLERYEPEEVQTGPAVRFDKQTIARHISLLSNYQEIKGLYELFTNLIEEHYSHERFGKI